MQAELNEIKKIREQKKRNNLVAYDKVLGEEGWATDPRGHYYAINDSEIGKNENGKGSFYYVSKKDMNRMNLTKSRNRVTTWDEKEALSQSENLHITPTYSEEILGGGRRRSSRRNRRGSRRHRRGTRRHRFA
jgi:hypothetical protein